MLQIIFEIIFDVCLCAFLAVFYILSYDFKTGTAKAGDILGAAGFPRIVIVLAFVLLVVQIISAVKKALRQRRALKRAAPVQEGEAPPEPEAAGDGRDRRGYIRVAACIGIIILYFILMKWAGYLIATFVFAFCFAKAVGYKSNWKLLIFAAVLAVGLTLVFGLLFSIPLPRGVGPLKEFSFYIY